MHQQAISETAGLPPQLLLSMLLLLKYNWLVLLSFAILANSIDKYLGTTGKCH
jgi:hypothetical protein